MDKSEKIKHIKRLSQNTMVQHIGIEFTDIGDDFVCGKMPVDHRTKQPLGMLHGGASAAFAETLASVASTLQVDLEKQYCVGLDINANHIRSVKSGWVFGEANPIHLGKKTQIWQIKIKNEKGEMVCISRMTMAVLDRS
ncbi:MAG: hotdog fold thioesterase [Candidatus Neomarinimicrobiota bacterium]|jgi:1,4-dihydroxy-2-naphthoyl-CoA hydrolase